MFGASKQFLCISILVNRFISLERSIHILHCIHLLLRYQFALPMYDLVSSTCSPPLPSPRVRTETPNKTSIKKGIYACSQNFAKGWMCLPSLTALSSKWKLKSFATSVLFSDHANFGYFTLWSYKRRLRNVQSSKMHALSYCFAHLIFCVATSSQPSQFA